MQKLLALGINWDQIADLGYWLLFFLGQSMYVLKRAGSAIRSPTHPVNTRWQFVKMNWDILAIRMSVGEFWIFWVWRHFSMAQIVGVFGFNYPAWLPSGVASSWVAAVSLGFSADSLLDWIGQNPKLPEIIRQFIKEQVPAFTAVPTVVVTSTVHGKDVETHSEVKSTKDE